MPRLTVIDVDSGFTTVLAKRLDAGGWEHRVTGHAPPVETLVAEKLDALVVNLAVLGAEAWDYLEAVRRRLPGLVVIVCTGSSSVAQRVRGLRLGADDWLTKPAHPEELIARVEACMRARRPSSDPEGEPVSAGDLEIRPELFQAFVNGASVDLTRREFELISVLAAAAGQVLERDEIYQRVWGYAMAHGDRSVDVFVRKLRQKLERASPGWRYIHTHFGVGYRFAAEPADGAPVPPPARPEPRAKPAAPQPAVLA